MAQLAYLTKETSRCSLDDFLDGMTWSPSMDFNIHSQAPLPPGGMKARAAGVLQRHSSGQVLVSLPVSARSSGGGNSARHMLISPEMCSLLYRTPSVSEFLTSPSDIRDIAVM